jgi:hypothetical protein
MEEKKEEKAVIESPSLKAKLGESLEILKAKVLHLKEKNQELMKKCKDQAAKIKAQTALLAERAGNSKTAIAAKSLYGKARSVKVLPKKQVVAFEIGGKTNFIYGYVVENYRQGYLVIRDASLIEYDLTTGLISTVRHIDNTPYIPRENVNFICDDLD